MRLKEFVIFIIIFTILYITFFIIFDKVVLKRQIKRERSRVLSLMNEKKYYTFACFYGVQKTLSRDLLLTIYDDIHTLKSFKLSDYSEKYQISVYELIIVILYFEYFQLIERKNIGYQENIINNADYKDQGLVYKYGTLFLDKLSYSDIINKIGNVASAELSYLQERFLVPGVRIMNSTIYYVGDLNEK